MDLAEALLLELNRRPDMWIEKARALFGDSQDAVLQAPMFVVDELCS